MYGNGTIPPGLGNSTTESIYLDVDDLKSDHLIISSENIENYKSDHLINSSTNIKSDVQESIQFAANVSKNFRNNLNISSITTAEDSAQENEWYSISVCLFLFGVIISRYGEWNPRL